MSHSHSSYTSPTRSRTGQTTPALVKFPPEIAQHRVREVSAGGGGIEGGHSAFVLVDEGGCEELWMCGHGRWGQLGTKAFTHVSEPKRNTTLARLRVWDEEAQVDTNPRRDTPPPPHPLYLPPSPHPHPLYLFNPPPGMSRRRWM